MSWNGDTRTATWRLLAGSSAKTLAPVATATRTGFETALSPPASAAFYAVQALDATGAVIGSPAFAAEPTVTATATDRSPRSKRR